MPTPAGSIESFWAEAQDAYAHQDWQSAFDYTTLVRRIDPGFEQATVDRMLFDVRVGLAVGSIAEGDWVKAEQQVAEAVKLRPTAKEVVAIGRALKTMSAPSTVDKTVARRELAANLLAVARTVSPDNPCAAVDQLTAATRVLPASNALDLLAEINVDCARAKEAVSIRDQLAKINGRFLYSTQEGDGYRIYAAPAEQDAASVRVIEDAAQPARQRRDTVTAFHNMRERRTGNICDRSGGWRES